MTPTEAEFFQDIGASLSPVGVEFTKPVTWAQFTIAFSNIIGLKRRSPKRGTLINFAIGDCLNAGEQLFGRKPITAWLRECRIILGMRDASLQLAGGLLILLQQLEEHIRLCCATLPSAALSMEDFFSDDPTKRRQTLGRLSRDLKGSQVFSKEFEERLDKLVFMRNQFIHHLWVNQLRKNSSPSPLPSREEYDIIMSALRALAVEASYFDDVFKGFRYELAIRITGTPPSPEEDPTPVARWTRYIELFHGALREGSSGRFSHETG
ncbi:MAG: hypothetical protein Q8S00_00555 [Deltaproteobacteria bacterium]|nr:hypothetical protein [Deltaproteobacteria bacterium]MDZ4346555.1 hypothetical protein [Candidatus Binatia bacterium]